MELSAPSKREFKRLKALKRYNISTQKSNFDFIIEAIASICEVPLCNVVLVGGEEISIIASRGMPTPTQFDRQQSTSQYTIQGNDLLEIADLTQDKRFMQPLLFGELLVRYYAGYPLIDSSGHCLGAVNIYDCETKTLTEKQAYFLRKAGDRITKLIVQQIEKERVLQFDNMFQVSGDLIGLALFDGSFVKVNPAFSMLLGWTEPEILAKGLLDFIHPAERERMHQLIEDLKAGIPARNFSIRFLTKEGQIRWIEWSATPDRNTELLYIIGRDITAIEEYAIQLKNSERKFRGFFENSQSLMCIHDFDGNFLSVNKTGANLIGYSVAEMEKKSLYNIIPEEVHHLLKEYLTQIKEVGHASGKMDVIRKDGGRGILLFNNSVEDDGMGHQYVIGNGVDLTERFQMEKELIGAKKNAEEANKVKSEFIANMSHEIRTPLNGIIGFTDLMMQTPLGETQQQYITIINQSANSLLNIVNEVLDFSKIESRNVALTIEKIDLQNLATEACGMVSYALGKKRLEMLLDISADLPRYIWADETRIKQVLVNLLSNAVKFTEKGEIKLSIRRMQDLPGDRMVLRFEVCDTGIGIQKDKQTQIFEAFTQEDNSIEKKYGGTGLGLTISNRLLKLAGSQLMVESEPDVGSCFSFDLQLQVEMEPVDNRSLEGINRLLMVDDNENNRRIIKRMLELKKIQVDEAESGLKALLMLQEDAAYDVIIMDYHMPIMNGIETIRKLKEIVGKDQPIVMLYSSSDDERLQEACDELDIPARLVKPIKMQEMYQVLAQLNQERIQQKIVTESAQIRRPCLNNIHVLIAEDNEVNLFLTKTLIQQIAPNSVITEARNGEEAIECYQRERPDIILMDIRMPYKNGLEATQAIRALEKDFRVPIVALTAGGVHDERERCLAVGMDDFMTKPIVKQSLTDMLCKWIDIEPDQLALAETTPLNRGRLREYNAMERGFNDDLVALIEVALTESARNLQAGVDQKNLIGLRECGHKLKGTSLAAGFTELCKLAVAFELLGDYDETYVQELLDSTLAEIERVLSLLDYD